LIASNDNAKATTTRIIQPERSLVGFSGHSPAL